MKRFILLITIIFFIIPIEIQADDSYLGGNGVNV